MELDEVDRRLIQAVLKDADRSLRALGEAVGVTAPTVANRLERLEALDLIGPVRREATLARLGTLILIEAPPKDREALGKHEHVFQVYRTQQNRTIALALLPGSDEVHKLHDAFPHATTTLLAEQTHASVPRFRADEVKTACDQCGKPIEGDEGIELTLGETRYVVCCPTCKEAIETRYQRHSEDATPERKANRS